MTPCNKIAYNLRCCCLLLFVVVVFVCFNYISYIFIYLFIYIYIYIATSILYPAPKKHIFEDMSGSCFEQNIDVLGSGTYPVESGTVENPPDFKSEVTKYFFSNQF